MRVRWFGIVVLLCVLLLNTIPAQAAIIVVDPAQPGKIIDDQATYDKLKKLKSALNPVILSATSPDDKFVLGGVVQGGAGQLVFFNIEDGSIVPVELKFPVRALTEYAWIDNQTVGFVGVSYENEFETPVVATFNRETGAVKTAPVRLPGFPVTLSPNGKRLIVAIPPEATTAQDNGAKAAEVNPLKSPFDWKVTRSFNNQPDYLKGIVAENIGPVARRNLLGAQLADASMQASTVAFNLAALDLTTGQVTPMFGVPAGTDLAAASWSADDSQVAFVRVYLAVLTSGQYSGGQLLNEAITRDALGELPPDKNPLYLGNGIDTFDFKTNTPHPSFLKAAGGNGDLFYGASWNTDGTALVALMVRPSRLTGRANPIYFIGESTYLRFYDAQGQLSGSLERPEFDSISVDPRYVATDEVIVTATKETNNWLYYYNRKSGEFRQISPNEGFSYFPTFTRNTRQVAYHFSSFMQAPELFRLNWDGNGLTQLTHLNDQLTQFGKVRADAVSFTLANGQKRTGYLLQSANSTFPPKNKPLIVWQEGGPPSSVWNAWGDIVERPFNLLPNFDYAVLFVPLIGRMGYGVERYKALYQNKAYGSLDIDEQAEIVQQLISQGWTTQGNVGITGCSYGGYFTTQSTVRHPTLYSAANAQCTLTDMFTEVQFDQSAAFMYITGATFTSDAAYYIQTSPLYNSQTVRTPTLLFHGINDFIPISTAANYHDQLQRNGIPVNLLGFRNEGHGLANPNNQLIAAQAQLRWFQQYLGSGQRVPAAR